MASKQQTLPEVPPPVFTDQDALWIRAALGMLYKSLERARSKYAPGSSMYGAVSVDLEAVRQLKEKFA